jgi:transcriptional regulator with XRE-family HTH domain
VKNDLTKLQRLIGRRIAALRIQRGVTQEALAEQSDVDARYIQRIEAGEVNLTLETLVRIANVLRVAVADVFVAANAPVAATRTRTPAPPALRNAKGRSKK